LSHARPTKVRVTHRCARRRCNVHGSTRVPARLPAVIIGGRVCRICPILWVEIGDPLEVTVVRMGTANDEVKSSASIWRLVDIVTFHVKRSEDSSTYPDDRDSCAGVEFYGGAVRRPCP
jgi:hypothetical protein